MQLWSWKLEIRFRKASPCRAPWRVKRTTIETKNLPMASSTHKRLRPDSDDDEHVALAIFTSQDSFARYLIIKSKSSEKPITSLSPFVIEKQIESTIGTGKLVKKLKDHTLLVETTRKGQTDNLKKWTLSLACQWKSLSTKA